jgi:glycerophosphoryl diester phosphodiesterase
MSVRAFPRPIHLIVAAAIPLLSLATSQAQAACNNGGPNLNRLFERKLTVIAHRGLWGSYALKAGASSVSENSTAAVQNAINKCMDAVELDVKMTSDGVPIIMHDFNLGRTTNVYQFYTSFSSLFCGKYDPLSNSGCNPTVARLDWAHVSRLSLLTTDRKNISPYYVPSVQQILNIQAASASRGENPPPLIFDIKTADAVRATATQSYQAFQKFRLGFNYQLGAKVNATLYSSHARYLADAKDDTYLRPIPVFTTNMLSKIDVKSARAAWAGYATEVNVKDTNKFLQQTLDDVKSSGQASGVFHALPDGPGSGQFYSNDGHCCYRLSDLYFTYNGVKETSDWRGDLGYINSQGFTFVTTDDPVGVKDWFHAHGRH